MATFQERLEEALTIRGIKPADLARLTGIGEGAISQYRKGAYKATQRNLEKIAQALNFSIPWLMGADIPADKTISPTNETRLLSLYRDLNSEGQEKLVDYADDLVTSGKYIKNNPLHMAAKQA